METTEADWTPRRLLELARRLYPWDQVVALHRSISSAGWKLMIADYHAFEARVSIRKGVPHALDKRQAAAYLAMLDLAGSEDAEDSPRFREAQFICEAHVIAAAQALHSVADILANAVYAGLDLASNPKTALPAERRNLYTVLGVLRKSAQSPPVAEPMSRFETSRTFQYLRAYVNTTKHISLIDRSFWVSLGEEDPEGYGMAIRPFRYESRGIVEEWPPKSIDEFLRESQTFVWQTAVDVGRGIETKLSSRAS